MPNNIKGKCIAIAFTTSAVSKNVLPLAPGFYNLTADQSCYVESGGDTVTPAAPSAAVAGVSDGLGSFPLWAAGYGIDVYISDGYVGVKGISAPGTLWLKPGVR